VAAAAPALLLAFVFPGSSLARQGETPPPNPVLRIGVVHPLRVRGTVDWNDSPSFQGYMPELSRAIARELGRDVEFVGIELSDPFAALATHRIDIVGLVSITDHLPAAAAGSTPVFIARGAAYTLESHPSLRSSDDLAGQQLVAAAAGVGDLWCSRRGLKCDAMETLQACFEAVLAGRADFVITTQNNGRFEIDRFGYQGLVEIPLDDDEIARPFAYAVRAEDRELLADLNFAIASLDDSGRLDAIYDERMERWQPRTRPASMSRRVIVWLLAGAAGLFVFAGVGQVVLRRELARRTRALRESETKHRAIFESSHDGILLVEPGSLTVVEANARAGALLGLSRALLVGRPLEGIDSQVLTGTAVHVLRAREGAEWIEVSSSRVVLDGREVLLVLARDVGERVRAEEERSKLETQLFHTQKLEGLGLLAGGIAHDFNNLLVGVTGNIDLALYSLDDPQQVRQRLEGALRATQRAADLTHQLLAYSGRAKLSEELVDLGTVVDEMVRLLGTSLTDRAKVTLDLAHELPRVFGDGTLIRQVTMNLLTNARDALGSSGGRIAVRTGVVHCDEAYLRGEHVAAEIAPGEYVFLEVEDDGCGMDAATLQRIFDPFFSTKFTGRGLGLSVVLKTVQRHLGAVKVRSSKGKGTSFRLLLPPVPRAVEAQRFRSIEAPAALAGRVLIVDDEPLVREVAQRMLESRGWLAIGVESADAALVELAREPSIDAVLLDVTMPGRNGFEVLRELRIARPELPVVMMSGFSTEVVEESGEEPDGFVSKPFTAAVLLEALAAATARRRELGARA
jgi:signal transduction histidine kinase/ActR/RegA family two-component response regulator